MIGYRKKFSGDLLQRSYAQIAEQFGCSVGQAKDAIVFLEQMGIVMRVFRTIEAKGMNYSNVLFLDLDANRLRELTYPSADDPTEVCADPGAPVPEYHQRGAEISAHPVSGSDRYTENTIQENTTKISAETSVRQSDRRVREKNDLADVENAEYLVALIRDRGSIPELDLKRSRMLVHWLCEYRFYTKHDPARTELRDHDHLKAYELFTECLCGMLCSRGAQTYCEGSVTAADVRDAVQRLAPHLACGGLDAFAMEVVRAFCEAMETRDVQNVKGYMKSVIWNAFAEFPLNSEGFYAPIPV